jgi:hypothetical protein
LALADLACDQLTETASSEKQPKAEFIIAESDVQGAVTAANAPRHQGRVQYGRADAPLG